MQVRRESTLLWRQLSFEQDGRLRSVMYQGGIIFVNPHLHLLTWKSANVSPRRALVFNSFSLVWKGNATGRTDLV
jgi:hypothetical protein